MRISCPREQVTCPCSRSSASDPSTVAPTYPRLGSWSAAHASHTARKLVARGGMQTVCSVITPCWLTTPLLRSRQIRELRVALEERELDAVGRAVAVLGHVHLGDPLLVGLVVVVLVAVDEHHEVGVLLDRTGLAQVGEDRALVVALLDGPRELRHG